MVIRSSPRAPAHVVIAGGGFAALEAALALRALTADRVALTLVSPERVLRYRPAAALEAFDDAPSRTFDLDAIADDLGARHHPTRLEAVAPGRRSVRLHSGAQLSYDALILAIGARARASIPGALTFRDQRDVPLLRGALRELDAGAITRLAVVVPSGSSWPLPLYELALLSAARAQRMGVDAEISVVTPEPEPLAVFGTAASRLVAGLLDDRGVHFMGDTVASGVRRDGSLALALDGALGADRVITTPQLRAHRIMGVPSSWWGFVPTDAVGRVEGLADVYAAGDMTTFPIKQGGLATQQSDRIAQTVAASLDGAAAQPPAPYVLQARLLGGDSPLWLSSELDRHGQLASPTLQDLDDAGWADDVKVFGRYLTPYLEVMPRRRRRRRRSSRSPTLMARSTTRMRMSGSQLPKPR